MIDILKAEAAKSGAKLSIIEAFVKRCRDSKNANPLCDWFSAGLFFEVRQ